MAKTKGKANVKAKNAGADTSSGGTQAIDRALDVLSGFVDHPEQGITDISNRSGLRPSTVHRIVRALVDAGYLHQSATSDRYHLGHSAVVLGRSASEALGYERALPVLEQLGGETGESVNMGVRDGGHVVVVLRVESVQPLRFDQPPGSRVALHCSSMGKAMLAFGDDTLKDLPLDAVTPGTITSKAKLKRQLEQVRELGFATDTEESIQGVSCVGAPVLNGDGEAVAAIAVQGPTVRMTSDRQARLGPRVLAAVTEISEILGLEQTT